MPLSSVKLKDDDRVNVEPTAVAGISAFLGKLWKMVEDSKTDNLISWGTSGNTFVIKNQIDFAKTILPNYYKHNNIASFIRQLNMYGFHKIISTTSGTLDSNDNDEIEFTHPCFVRGHPYLLEQIKRKMNNPKENFSKNETGNQFNESIKRVFNDIKNLKGKTEHLGSQLSAVKQENEILWRELSLLRQKHAAQQNVLNKLIRFLVSFAQPSNHGIVKRRLVPLMLKDASSSRTKQESVIQDNDHIYTMKKQEEPVSPGPTIHEIHSSEILDGVEIIETPVIDVTSDTPVILESEIIPSSPSSVSNFEANVTSPEPVPAALLLPTRVRKNKNRLQKVYVPTGQPVPTHFLISQPSKPRSASPEYLIPDSTDNPLMELVHETVADEDSDYITVVTNDDDEISSENTQERSGVTDNKKKRTVKRTAKKSPVQVNVKNVPPKSRADSKKKGPSVKEKTNENIDTNDFLVDIDLDNVTEPMVKIHIPSSSGITKKPIDIVTSSTLNPCCKQEVHQTDTIPIDVDEIISMPSRTDLDALNLMTDNNCEDSMISTDAIHKNTDEVVFDLNEERSKPFVDTSEIISDENRQIDGEALIKRIKECMDETQDKMIACTTDNSVPPTRAYVDDISMQLDSMQSDLNSIKELIQHEGLTLDVNTLMGLFNEDPLDYSMPSDGGSGFPKPNNDKIVGNELITAPSIFDFNDIFSQNEWSSLNTPMTADDSDYCNLNTPQIERNSTDENQSGYASPSKKIKSF